jgi:acyl carrier protein
MDIKAQIREFLIENFYVTEPELLTDDASLLDLGIVDSTGVLEVIDFLEQELDVPVDDAEMRPENLDSIDNLVAFITRKKQPAA